VSLLSTVTGNPNYELQNVQNLFMTLIKKLLINTTYHSSNSEFHEKQIHSTATR
jgi:hypothetical protein